MESSPANQSAKRKMTQTDWKRYSEEWEESDETQTAFCQRRQLCYSTFVNWRSRFVKRQNGAVPPTKFKPISVTPLQKTPLPIQVCLPGGIRVMLPCDLSDKLLRRYFKLLGVTTC